MTVLVTPAAMRAAERAAVDAGTPEPELMSRAATAIATWIVEHTLPQRRAPGAFVDERPYAVALVGPGNNGGDALVTLTLLVEHGWRVGALMLGRSEFGTLPANAADLLAIERVDESALAIADIILDGVYGIGSRTRLSDDVLSAFAAAHAFRLRQGTPLLAIDVPSGVDAASAAAHEGAFHADVTLCLGLPKVGLVLEPAASRVGELVVLDIGIREPSASNASTAVQMLSSNAARKLVPERQASAHKSNAGTVLIVAGAPRYYGAPRLSSGAALRAGVGLVALATPSELVATIAGALPEIVMLPLASDDPSAALATIAAFVSERASTLRAWVIGPGLGDGPSVDTLLEALLGSAASQSPTAAHPRVSRPCVIDADGLNWIARRGRWPEQLPPGSAVFTPHVGELARLLRVDAQEILSGPWEHARRAARESGQYVVLKFGYTAVAAPDGELWIAPRAMPEMATAGTGDVLAGTIGGLLAQGLAPFDAAKLAVYVGSQAGLAARQKYGTLSVVASDIIVELPRALAALSEPHLRYITGAGREETAS